ncbi:MAG: hypothetical protein FWE80_01255 [Oscillospiraceae bacterium]|nr:hypothetical protein [Oscillospiraceae bacterium]
MTQKKVSYTALKDDGDEFFLRELTALLDSDDEFAALMNIPVSRGRAKMHSQDEKAEPEKTEALNRHLQAIPKNHLLTVVRELERELTRVKQERKNLFLAYQVVFM